MALIEIDGLPWFTELNSHGDFPWLQYVSHKQMVAVKDLRKHAVAQTHDFIRESPRSFAPLRYDSQADAGAPCFRGSNDC